MEMRDEKRIDSEERVLYSIDDVVMTDRLINLSRKGCMIHASHGLGKRGDEVEITLMQGVVAKGRVTWAKDRVLGVSFERPLNKSMVRYFETGRMAEPEHYRPADRFGRPMPPLNSRGT